jgi:hypothetical protein
MIDRGEIPNANGKSALAMLFYEHGRVVFTVDADGKPTRYLSIRHRDRALLTLVARYYGGKVKGEVWRVTKRASDAFAAAILPYSFDQTAAELDMYLRAGRLLRAQRQKRRGTQENALTRRDRDKRHELAARLAHIKQGHTERVVFPERCLVRFHG